MNDSSLSSGQTAALSGRWWQSVTLAELAQASAVIDEFTGEFTAAPAVTSAQFARAVVLHMLCIDAGVMEQLITRADARSATLMHALQLDGDSPNASVDAYASWLTRRQAIGTALKACAGLLSSPLREAVDAKADRFIQASTEHQNIFFTVLFGRGLQKPTSAPCPASFRQPRALKSGRAAGKLGPE